MITSIPYGHYYWVAGPPKVAWPIFWTLRLGIEGLGFGAWD